MLALSTGVLPHPTTTESTELLPLAERALPGCEPDTYRHLAEFARVVTVKRDDVIFRQGGPIPLTLVVRGHGAFRRTTVHGQVMMVDVARPSDLFGFSAIASTRTPVDFVALSSDRAICWAGRSHPPP